MKPGPPHRARPDDGVQINGHLMSVFVDDHPTMFVDRGVLTIQLEGRGANTASFRNLWLKNLP